MDTLRKIKNRSATIGIIGLGYVGLPLARRVLECGFPVVGLDVDETKIATLKEGRSYIRHIPGSDVSDMLASGFAPTTDFSKMLPECDVILICVPTPLDKMREPDLEYVRETTETVARSLRSGQLVVLESTTYPGTTREVMLPVLEQLGQKVEEDFLLAYSPEREDPGNSDFSVNNIPKVVGGIGPKSLEAAAELYSVIAGDAVQVSSCEAAEASKIVENIYRCVNIAMVNELKMLFDKMGIDVHEVLNAAGTKPFGFQKFTPGPGLGGHCIPIDPFYLSWKARQYEIPTRFIELAGEINTGMPQWVVNKTIRALNDHGKAVRGSRILILGLAYKPNVDDVRESPSLKLIELLQTLGAEVDYHDPHCPETHPMREYDLQMKSIPGDTLYIAMASYDCVLIATDHDWYDWNAVLTAIRDGEGFLVDTRNAVGTSDGVVQA